MLENVYLFVDRVEAGKKLAARLLHEPAVQETAMDEMILLSIPSGGVVVGATVARILGCNHDIIAAKKFNCPWHEELVMGAVAERDVVSLSNRMRHECFHKGKPTGLAIEHAKAGVESYINKFRGGRSLDLSSKLVILVDDGIASGETIKAAIKWLTSRDPAHCPKKLIVAVPICSANMAAEIRQLTDHFICLSMPSEFWTVGSFYWDFSEVSDETVMTHIAQWAVDNIMTVIG